MMQTQLILQSFLLAHAYKQQQWAMQFLQQAFLLIAIISNNECKYLEKLNVASSSTTMVTLFVSIEVEDKDRVLIH